MSTWLSTLTLRLLRSIRPARLLGLALLLTLMAVPGLSSNEVGAVGPVVRLDPATSEIPVHTIGYVDVVSEGTSDVYGAEFTVTFDATYLQVVDEEPGNPTVQILPGTCPQDDFVPLNAADNGAGTVDYAVTQMDPTPPCAGGTIASIGFQCVDLGLTESVIIPLQITKSIISDHDGNSLAHAVENGQVVCNPESFFIRGIVVPQGTPHDATGVTVCRNGTDCQVTGTDGTFRFAAQVRDSPHTITGSAYAHLGAEMASIVGEAGQTVDIGSTTLRAGDLNSDGAINILDLTMVGGNFLKSDPQPWTP